MKPHEGFEQIHPPKKVCVCGKWIASLLLEAPAGIAPPSAATVWTMLCCYCHCVRTKSPYQSLLSSSCWQWRTGTVCMGQSTAVTRSHARLAASQDHMALLVGSSDVALLWAAPHLYPGPRSFSILRCCSCQEMLGQASCLMSMLVQGVRFWTRSLWGHVPTATKRPVESLQWLSGHDPPFVTPNSAVGKQSWSGSTWEAKHEKRWPNAVSTTFSRGDSWGREEKKT